MRKFRIVLVCLLCLMMTACSNEFAKREYDSDEKIAQNADHYAKKVYIDSEDNVTTVIECLPETSTDGFVTKTLPLKRGKNRLKIVGYDCEDIDLKMLFTDK